MKVRAGTKRDAGRIYEMGSERVEWVMKWNRERVAERTRGKVNVEPSERLDYCK